MTVKASPDGTRVPAPATDKDGHVWEIRLGQGTIPPWGMPPTDGVAIWRDGELTNGVAMEFEIRYGIPWFSGRNGNVWRSLGKDSAGRWAWADVGTTIPAQDPDAPPPPPPQPQITGFAVTPSTVTAGQPVELTAHLDNVTHVTLDGVEISLPYQLTPSASRSVQIVGVGAAGTTSAISPSIAVTVTAVSAASFPTSADFVALASDARGGDAAYNFLRRLSDGRMIAHGGFSHDRTGNNAVMILDPVKATSVIDFPHTPWVDAPDASGRNYLGNHDNQLGGVVDDVLWEFGGESGTTFLGNLGGQYDSKPHDWHIEDDPNKWAPIGGALEKHENGAFVHVPAFGSSPERWVIFGGRRLNPTADMQVVKRAPAGSATPYVLERSLVGDGSAPFPGAMALDFIASQAFARQGKVYLYGGAFFPWDGSAQQASNMLVEINLDTPAMTVYATNALANAVRGGSIYADLDAVRDQVVISNGVNVQVFDFPTKTFADVPVNTAADANRNSPSDQQAPRAACFSPEAGSLVILGGHSRIYKLALNYGAVVTQPPPPPPTGLSDPPGLVAGVFYGVPSPLHGTGFSTQEGSKHTTVTPINSLDRLVFIGGDYSDNSGEQSYRQQVWFCDLAAKLAAPTDPQSGWSLGYPRDGFGGTTVQPKRPDFCGFPYDEKRGLCYFVPGAQVPSTQGNSPGETPAFASDPNFLYAEVMAFDPRAPIAQRWSRPGVPRNPDVSGDQSWLAYRDPVRDTIQQLAYTGGDGVTLSELPLPLGSGPWKRLSAVYPDTVAGATPVFAKDGQAWDFQKRVGYGIDGLHGRLKRWNMDSPQGWTDLGPVPGGGFGVENFGFITFDSKRRLLMFWRAGWNAFTMEIYALDVDAGSSWLQRPNVTNQASQPIAYVTHTLCYIENRDLHFLAGGEVNQPNGQFNNFHWFYRYA